MCPEWDPSYLSMLFRQDFYDMDEYWNASNSVLDNVLIQEINRIEKECVCEPYVPIIEDIMIKDNVLLNAVNEIEKG